MSNFGRIVETLTRHRVEFVVVGGVAAVLHGAPVTTFDLDTLVRVSAGNADRLLAALAELDARYREHRQHVVRPTREDVLAGGHMLLMTSAGPLDVLGFIGNRNRYEDLEPQIEQIALREGPVPVLSLEELLRQKRALGRDKDQPAIRLLEEVLRRRK